MALITFTSPEYKDKTIYAVAGSHTGSILKAARSNKIPLGFDCEDGECGSCLVRVTSVDRTRNTRMGGPLTDKEIKVLRSLGKLSKEEVDSMAVSDLPTEWRLACQMIPRDEDILVEY
jgi:ferredoxin